MFREIWTGLITLAVGITAWVGLWVALPSGMVHP